MVKTEALSFRVEEDLKAALEQAAEADDRSVSAMTERILRAWLEANGYLQRPAPTGRRKGR